MSLRLIVLLAGLFGAGGASAQSEAVELIGHLGSREALMVLFSSSREDGSFRVTGEYVVLNSMQRRFLEGERSPQLGVTTLREGISQIMFGRAPAATLQGTWRGGVLKGVRLGPGGQEREQFEFSERFPSMAGYSARVQCDARSDGYSSSLAFVLRDGRLVPESFSWTSRQATSGHVCVLGGGRVAQLAFPGGVRLALGARDESGADCTITLRNLGSAVRVVAEHCSAFCGSQAYLESMLVDRTGRCELFRPTVQ